MDILEECMVMEAELTYLHQSLTHQEKRVITRMLEYRIAAIRSEANRLMQNNAEYRKIIETCKSLLPADDAQVIVHMERDVIPF